MMECSNQLAVVSGGLSTAKVRSAVRLSFAQAMVGAVYMASTGGMFLIGYAKTLGANNPQIGLMSTLPMLCVFAQMLSSVMVERGVSRRWLTYASALGNVLGWALIIVIPYALVGQSSAVKVGMLIAIITLVTFFGNISVNARASWVGDLIPERFRARFFGRLAMFSGIVAVVFAIAEGAFLDQIKAMGLGAFSLLFGFGMIFGLANALLFRFQSDVRLEKPPVHVPFGKMIGATFANRPLLITMAFVMTLMLQSVAGPFFVKYMLDLNMTYLGIGMVNSVMALVALAAAPLWGRVVGRFGCRPVLVICCTVLAPLPIVWWFVDSPRMCYLLIPLANIVAGFCVSGLNVGLSTLMFKVTPSVGRSVQFAINSIIVAVLASPMPYLGGLLPGFFGSLGLNADLRWCFYAAGVFMCASAVVGRSIREENSSSTNELLSHLVSRVWPLRRPR